VPLPVPLPVPAPDEPTPAIPKETYEQTPTEQQFLEGNDAYLAVKLALSKHRGFDPNQSEKKKLKSNLAEHRIRADLVPLVVDRFVKWVGDQAKEIPPSCVASKTFLTLLTGEESLDTDTPDSPSTPVSLPPIDLQPISPKSPPDIPPASPHNGLPPLALRWNEVVHSGPPVVAWKEQSNGDFLLRTLMSDPVFQRESETALAKAEKLCAAKHPKGSYLTFGWFIKPGKWCEVLNGQHDWLLGDGPAQQPKKGMGALIEQFKAECEAKKGDKNLDSHVE
jgi:hypothetical protein